MSEHSDEDMERAAQKRLQPFLDCISYLLARRWICEQREQTEEPPEQQNEELSDEPPV